MIPRDTHDGAFYRAVLALHQDLFSLAQQVGYIIAQQHTQWRKCTSNVYILSQQLIKETIGGIWNVLVAPGTFISLHSKI